MKKNAVQIVSMIVLTISIAAVSASAQLATSYTGKIPFDFNAGKVAFKAGEYKIRLADPTSDNGLLVISDSKGRNAKIVMPLLRAADWKSGFSMLIFNRYDGQNFLSEIVTPTLNAEFRKTEAERQLVLRQDSRRETIAVKNLK